MPHCCPGVGLVGLRPCDRVVGGLVGLVGAAVMIGFLVAVGLVGLLPGRLVVGYAVVTGRAVVMIGFFVVVGLLLRFGFLVVAAGVHAGIGVVRGKVGALVCNAPLVFGVNRGIGVALGACGFQAGTG